MNKTLAVADYILNHTPGDVDFLKLKGLLYASAGASLAIADRELIDEQIRLTEYSIKIDSLQHALIPIYGARQPIKKDALCVYSESIVFRDKELIDKVIEQFGSWTGVMFSNWTHEEQHVFSRAKNGLKSVDDTYVTNRELKESFSKIFKLPLKNVEEV